MRISLLLLLAACTGAPVDTNGKDGSLDDSGDTGDTDDTGQVEETGETGETAETGETGTIPAELISITWTVALPTAITTREPLDLSVTGQYDDGTTADVTGSASFASSDEAVILVVGGGVGQPLFEGSATVTATVDSFELAATVDVSLASAIAGDLVFNEVLADGTVDGDPNADGTLDSVEDEFVEIANMSDVTVDLSGYTLVEDDFYHLPRHTFAAGTVLQAGQAIVVFGGGDLGALSATNCWFVTAENEDSALPYGLSLNNSGETIWLNDTSGAGVASFAYGGSSGIDVIEDASYVLNPEVYSTDYTHHSYATGSTGDFSPCLFVDGSAYTGPDGRF